MLILNSVFSSGRYIYGIILSLLQYQFPPIQQPSTKFLFGIDIMLLGLHQVHLLCPSQGHNLLEMDWWFCCCAWALGFSPVSISYSC